MHSCSECGSKIFHPRIDVDSSYTLDRSRTESGPASVQPDEVTGILQNGQRDLNDYETDIHSLESRRMHLLNQQERLRKYAAQV